MIHSVSPKKYVLVAGTKKLKNDVDFKVELTKEIGRLIAAEPDWVLLNGGAKSSDNDNTESAVDYFAAYGAYEYAKENGLNPSDKILTIKPIESTHPEHNFGKQETSLKKTSALRRFDLVARADAIITIEGDIGSMNILELGLSLGKPIFPCYCTGGSSEIIWNNYEYDILEIYDLKKDSGLYQKLTGNEKNAKELAKCIVSLLKRVLRPVCFVAMPYTEVMNTVYTNCLEKAISAAGLIPIRADKLTNPENIISDMHAAISRAKIIIADITEINPNVYFEIGYAYALNKAVYLISKFDAASKIPEPPIDVKFMRIEGYIIDNLDALYDRMKNILMNKVTII